MWRERERERDRERLILASRCLVIMYSPRQLRSAEFQRQISKVVTPKDIRRMIWEMREMVRMSDEAKADLSYVVDEMEPAWTYIEKMREYVRALDEAQARALGMLVICM